MSLNAFTPHRPAREPMVNVPLAVVVLIGILVVIHVARLAIGEETDFRVLVDFAFVPARLTIAIMPSQLDDILAAAASRGGQNVLLAQLLLQEGSKLWTLITHAFLHGSWTHLIFNALWLLAFGSPVARRFGAARFFLLLALCAVAGAVFYALFNPYGTIPMIGASGAISGVMAAACRFVFQPGMPWLGHQEGMGEFARAQSWREILRDRRAMSFIAVWFGVNLVFGVVASPLGLADGGIAWEAHIGGFVAGFLLFPLLDPVARRRR